MSLYEGTIFVELRTSCALPGFKQHSDTGLRFGMVLCVARGWSQ